MTLQVDLWMPEGAPTREIIQIMPADGWDACCWQDESNEYSRLPLIGWALVRETSPKGTLCTRVVGLCASMSDQSRRATKCPPVFFADDLINFRFYAQPDSQPQPIQRRHKSSGDSDQDIDIDIDAALIVQALVHIRYPAASVTLKKPDWSVANIARIAQQTLPDVHPRRHAMTPKRVGLILRNQLGIVRRGLRDGTGRRTILIDDGELADLMQRFGINKPERDKGN
ncbi:MAG: hypothetical protein DCC55_34970 [Chloroflexi bacterium]|nr:MAG: hypothetical protein DCC55_34970 [Chloroflexota bacterium]